MRPLPPFPHETAFVTLFSAPDGPAAGRVARSGGWLTDLNSAMVRPGNGVDFLPSLHVALPVYFFRWEFQGHQRAGALVFLTFAVLRAWSTVYLRQHCLVDVLSGAALGYLAALLFRRRCFSAIGIYHTSCWNTGEPAAEISR